MANLTHDQITQYLQGTTDHSSFPEPSWGPIGREVYERSYSRIKEDGTPEVWAETVRRTVLGNLAYSPEPFNIDEAVRLFELIYLMRAIPAGRHLWMTGIPGAALKNCHRAGWSADTVDHFRFLAQHLFMGGGVGSNYSAKYRERGGKVYGYSDIWVTCSPDHPDYTAVHDSAGELWLDQAIGKVIRVEDTREGWVAAWCSLIGLALESAERDVTFDLTDIRPHGAPLVSFGGRASGPAPLAGSIVSITNVLHDAYEWFSPRHLTAIECMKIDHYMAAAIVAGGTRRSARMSQLNWNDPEILDFISHKEHDPSVSWSTNISVVVDDEFFNDQSSNSDILKAIAFGMVKNGEPGIYNQALAQIGELRDVGATNPCGEATLEEHYDPITGQGSSSGESCNLGSVDLDAFGTDLEGAKEAFALMTRFLYRATLAPVYDADQAEIEDRNRRLGIGVMGLQGWVAAYGAKLTDLPYNGNLIQHLAEFQHVSRLAANELADELGLPHPIKVTAVAPNGTIAQLRGTTSGIQPVVAKYFIRRVQYSDTDPGLIELKAKGYDVEDSVYADHTEVVSFPVRDVILDQRPEYLIEQADEVSVDQFLRIQAAVQGSFCGGEDGQAISATANIPATGVTANYLAAVLQDNLPNLKGVTVFPAVSRPQTPIEAISKERWQELSNGRLAFGDSNSGGCLTGSCPIR